MNIKLPLKSTDLPISAAHANEWKSIIMERLPTMSESLRERLEIKPVMVEFSEHVVFWSEKGLVWALMYLPPAALTASERAAWAIGLIPDSPERTLAALDILADKLQSLSVDAAAMASRVRPNKQTTQGRVTDYVSPEAIAMYRAMHVSCNSSKHPHRRHMCKEWRDDYKAFERYFLEHNVREIFDDVGGTGRYKVDKEGVIACALNDPDSLLHGQVVYGPGTVMFVSKATQNFYNRTKRDFRAKLDEMYEKKYINEAEHKFMKNRGD